MAAAAAAAASTGPPKLDLRGAADQSPPGTAGVADGEGKEEKEVKPFRVDCQFSYAFSREAPRHNLVCVSTV